MTKEYYHFFSGDYENPTKMLEVETTNLSFQEITTLTNQYLREYEDCYVLVFDDEGKLIDAYC